MKKNSRTFPGPSEHFSRTFSKSGKTNSSYLLHIQSKVYGMPNILKFIIIVATATLVLHVVYFEPPVNSSTIQDPGSSFSSTFQDLNAFISRTFQGWKIQEKIRDFPGYAGTLHSITNKHENYYSLRIENDR